MDASLQLVALSKVIIAVLLGGIIGVERENIGKPAGMRTHMLIAGASTLFVLLGKVIILNYCMSIGQNDFVRGDPIRVIQAIVLGISFIGAGTIIQHQERKTVIYLTSAASILFTAALGICVALDLYILAAGSVVIVLLINRGLRYFDKKILKRRKGSSVSCKDAKPFE
ncbi:MgtC/SapB transporter [Thermovirga lienii DSM 17291]|jgi:putative Mg2+ transporter-C (MgtC) family protein|uniref:MgtC/SapB transporter n=1 Tax=Thermovirga lienii (strain ATCC BAA-1197 / DSM 17291 / Cas60314) TaxID=580340 RepID=G7V5H3_THELD|nr:MgtC/SapB family protein [Thermovirga lienii]AER65800.1 MgtC/SapB transporter [Thermovirga lienii DSM 17291]